MVFLLNLDKSPMFRLKNHIFLLAESFYPHVGMHLQLHLRLEA